MNIIQIGFQTLTTSFVRICQQFSLDAIFKVVCFEIIGEKTTNNLKTRSINFTLSCWKLGNCSLFLSDLTLSRLQMHSCTSNADEQFLFWPQCFKLLYNYTFHKRKCPQSCVWDVFCCRFVEHGKWLSGLLWTYFKKKM